MFDDLTDIYDAMIDWPKRLAHEGSFYRRVFEQHDVRSVVDVACGTGRHAAMFHSWGLRVEAADLSPAMIDRRGRCLASRKDCGGSFAGLMKRFPRPSPSVLPSALATRCRWPATWQRWNGPFRICWARFGAVES